MQARAFSLRHAEQIPKTFPGRVGPQATAAAREAAEPAPGKVEPAETARPAVVREAAAREVPQEVVPADLVPAAVAAGEHPASAEVQAAESRATLPYRASRSARTSWWTTSVTARVQRNSR
jgi:hypothetical protein